VLDDYMIRVRRATWTASTALRHWRYAKEAPTLPQRGIAVMLDGLARYLTAPPVS
jgi:hypothetical protein